MPLPKFLLQLPRHRRKSKKIDDYQGASGDMRRSCRLAQSTYTSATPIRQPCWEYISLIAQRQIDRTAPSTHVMGVARFERFFRTAARLDVDKQDLKRYNEFINHKIYDLLLRAEAAAKANGRDIIEPFDLPIELQPILDYLTARPPLDLAYSDTTEGRLPAIAGGLSVALARSFKILDPDLKNPETKHWERCFQIFDLLL
jgi:hypothetical protein